jgi:hypothetical protein
LYVGVWIPLLPIKNKGLQAMRDSPIKYSDFKLNVRVRDFFVDFLACLIPGFIFLVASSLIVIGFVFMNFLDYIYPANEEGFKGIFLAVNGIGEILSIKFWIYIGIVILSYVVGHLLYRQDPKEPDYHSFIKIRQKVMGYNAWVISKGDGLIPEDVQFPYSNLKNYLKARNFDYLFPSIKWDSRINSGEDETNWEKNEGDEKAEENARNSEDRDKSRSKSFINQLKTRIHFFYPESTFNIIKNEAHIRLASSMWYASKYILTLFYYSLPIFIFYIAFLLRGANFFSFSPEAHFSADSLIQIVCLVLVLSSIYILYRGQNARRRSERVIGDAARERNEKRQVQEEEQNEIDGIEEDLMKKAEIIHNGYLQFDRSPLFCALLLLIAILLMYFHGSTALHGYLSPSSMYIITLFFIILGTLFMKHRIEDSFHYQRVREIIFVLETAHLACVLSEEHVDKIRGDTLKSFQYYCPYAGANQSNAEADKEAPLVWVPR